MVVVTVVCHRYPEHLVSTVDRVDKGHRMSKHLKEMAHKVHKGLNSSHSKQRTRQVSRLGTLRCKECSKVQEYKALRCKVCSKVNKMYKECHKVQRGLVRSGFHNSNKGLRAARQVVYLVLARQVVYVVHGVARRVVYPVQVVTRQVLYLVLARQVVYLVQVSARQVVYLVRMARQVVYLVQVVNVYLVD